MRAVEQLLNLLVKVAMWLTEQSFKLMLALLQLAWNVVASVWNAWASRSPAQAPKPHRNRRPRHPRGWGRKWQKYQR